jgi:5-methylcytosine-specific restriction endonuclease McrA
MKIRIDKADQVFSQYVRLRDMECRRCHSSVRLNDKDLPVSHQASHYFGRGRENTRFDPENVDTLCHGCHQHWGSADKEGYREFKLTQLGQKDFDLLTLRANSYAKKDRAYSFIIAKSLLTQQLLIDKA